MRILEIVKAINNNPWFIFVGTVLASLAAISTIYSNNKKDKKNEKIRTITHQLYRNQK